MVEFAQNILLNILAKDETLVIKYTVDFVLRI